MASKIDFHSSFNWNAEETKTTVSKKKIKLAKWEIVTSSLKTVNNEELEFVKDKGKKPTHAEHYSNIPEHIRGEVERYAWVNATKAALQVLEAISQSYSQTYVY